jgi:DNA-binding CsgD family transcriptional regulator
MDWFAVAQLVAERAGVPALLLNARGQALLVTPAAEKALGWRASNPTDDWIAQYVPPQAAPMARWLLAKALAGALRRLEVEVVTRSGTATALFEAQPLRADADGGVLLVLEGLTPTCPSEQVSDYDYEVHDISSGGFNLGTLWKPGCEARHGQGRCFEVLHARATPCEGCPLLLPSAAGGVKARAQSPRDYLLTTSIAIGGDSARVSVRHLPMASLSAMMQARLDELSVRACLSARERSIFGHLMDGLAVAEIAEALAIKPRTVKFHQANVLHKLGAESRTQLLRLVSG